MTYITRAAQFNHQQAVARGYWSTQAQAQGQAQDEEHETPDHIHDRVFAELTAIGMPKWGLWRLDVRHLPSLIHENEHIKAAVYGKGKNGAGMLVATDRRVLYINKQPMFMKSDELTYDIIGGVSYADVGVQATVVLHSRVADFRLTTFNLRLAQGFRDHIEQRCLEHAESPESRQNRYEHFL